MAASNKKPVRHILGGIARDHRVSVGFVNEFDFSGIKRFYRIENAGQEEIRAFHGHMKEEKFVFVAHGKAIVCAVEIDHPTAPNPKNKVHRFVLDSEEPSILHIPGGYANGTRSIEPGTKILFFSTATTEESKGDDYRVPHDYWGMEHWNLES